VPLPLAPPDTAALLHAALVHHAASRTAEAETLYRRILEDEPDNARALGMLAIILSDGPDAAEAEAMLLRHLVLRPQDGASLHRLGRLRARAGDDATAAELFGQAALALPRLPPIHNDLAVSLHRLGRRHEALDALDRAVALDPGYAAAHGNRGVVLYAMERFADAAQAQLDALALITPAAAEERAAILHGLSRAARKAGLLPAAEAALRAELDAGHDDPDTVEQLSLVLDWSGRAPEALALRNGLARRTGLHRSGAAQGARATVLVLAGVGGGLVPTRYLVDPQTFTILALPLLSADQADAPLGAVDIDIVRQADVVFNTLADIDHDGGQFDSAEAFCALLGKPVLNPPRTIRRTGRDQATALFGDIADMVTPAVRYADPADLADLEIEAPILVRPSGDHGGDNLVLLRDDADKAAFLAKGPRGPLLVTQFHDFRSPDGYWRKYRLIFVDRQVHPYHLAIGEDWLLHYWRAEMQRSPWKMAEEERFLQDWRGVFGERAARAVEEAARRLDLDYGGMDCALTADGKVLLFEANACILLHLDEPAAAFPYKHRHTPPIRDAFTRLVLERAGR
jgi:tetratricopeptide (TPR) repeat protein